MQRLEAWREKLGRSAWRLTAPRLFWTVLPLYVLVLFLLRWALMPVASQDDAEQLILAQSLAGGYGPAQPPLYTWLIWLVGQVFGPGLPAVLAVKFFCLYLLFAFMAAAAATIIPASDQARLAPLGLLGLSYVGYEAVFNYSNTIVQAAATAGTIWAIAVLYQRRAAGPGAGAFAWLGLAVGLGLLSKYGYALFLGGTVAAMFMVGPFRRLLLRRGIWITITIAVLLLLPYVVWLFAEGIDLAQSFGQRLAAAPTTSFWAIVAKGLFKLVNGVAVFLFPLAVLAVFFFPRAAFFLPPGEGAERDFIRLGNRFFVIVVAILVAAVLILEIPNVRTHYMFVFIGFPLWWLLRIRTLDFPHRRYRQYATVLAVLGIVWPLVIIGRWAVEPMVQKRPYFHFPYAQLAAQFKVQGFDGRGTIVADFQRVQIGGNLKAQFPRAAVASTKYPYYKPPAAGRGPCLLIWRTVVGEAPPARLLAFAKKMEIEPGRTARRGVVKAPIPRSGGRVMSLSYILIPEMSNRCG